MGVYSRHAEWFEGARVRSTRSRAGTDPVHHQGVDGLPASKSMPFCLYNGVYSYMQLAIVADSFSQPDLTRCIRLRYQPDTDTEKELEYTVAAHLDDDNRCLANATRSYLSATAYRCYHSLTEARHT
jgi:hypothetical protein